MVATTDQRSPAVSELSSRSRLLQAVNSRQACFGSRVAQVIASAGYAISVTSRSEADADPQDNRLSGPLPAPARPRPVRETTAPRRSRKRPGKPAEGIHPIIRSALAEFRRSRPIEGEGYLKPYKKLLPSHG